MTRPPVEESPAYRLLAGWVGLVYAGLLWLAALLGLVTAPAGTCALFAAVRRLHATGERPSAASFVADTRRHLPAATRAGLLAAAGWVLLGAALASPVPPWPLARLLPYAAVPALLMWALTTVWVFPVLQEQAGGARDAFRVAYLRAVRHPLHAVASCGAWVLLAAAVAGAPAWLTLPAGLSVPGAGALLVSLLADHARGPAAADPRPTDANAQHATGG